MSQLRSYIPPVELGARDAGPRRRTGDRKPARRSAGLAHSCSAFTGWQEYCVADDSVLEFPFTVCPTHCRRRFRHFWEYLATPVFQRSSVSSWAIRSPGETVVVFGRRARVGSIAGQLAKQRGARVVGIAGGAEKCRHLVEEPASMHA